MNHHKLRIINSLEQSMNNWERQGDEMRTIAPIKTLKQLPSIIGITKKAAFLLRLKSFIYLLYYDQKKVFYRYFFKKPIHYGIALVKSYLQKKSYQRDRDFFFYGIKNERDFLTQANQDNTLIVVGFSYCHKPFECPHGRFSEHCQPDPKHPVCSQCFIGKIMYHLPQKNVMPLCIPTIHYVGEKMFELREKNPKAHILFLITACEMTLEMFGDWGNMISARGIGVRLDGRICNTMRAFHLSERGVKPGLTVITDPTKKRIEELLLAIHRGL